VNKNFVFLGFDNIFKKAFLDNISGGYGMYGYGYGNDIIQKSRKLFLETNKRV